MALLLFVLSRTGPDPASANPLTDALAVAAGGGHTCALTTAGGVQCWGLNNVGQLGDGQICGTSSCTTPVDVSGLTSGVAAVAAGSGHTCALTTAGGLKCWGNNGSGQLGDGTTTTRTTPVVVSGLASGLAAVAAGQFHTCAVTTGGGAKCWGNNFFGKLGDGTSGFANFSATPVDVSDLTSGVADLGAGRHHTCALTTAGGLKCWGQNNVGQLGDGQACGIVTCTTPVDVSGLSSGVAAVAAAGGIVNDGHTCAVTTAGGVKCWGDNNVGQLGDGTTTDRATPVDVSGLTSGVVAAAAGSSHTCAITTAGGLKCWGNNSSGQLGDGNGGVFGDSSPTPVDVVGMASGVAAVAAGSNHTCAVTTTGGLKCWGNNDRGQLGDGTTTNSTMPVDVIAVVKPTPTPTPCPPEGCPTPTITPTPMPIPQGFDTNVNGNAGKADVGLGDKFGIQVIADRVPADPITGFSFLVTVSAGLKYNGTGNCASEVKPAPPLGLFPLCIQTGNGTTTHGVDVGADLGVPPLAEIDVSDGSALANFTFTCNTLGSYTISVAGGYQRALDASPIAAHSGGQDINCILAPDEQININVVDKLSGDKLEGTCWRISYGLAKVPHDVVGDDAGGVKPDCGEPSNLKLFDKDPSPGNLRITITSAQRIQFGSIWHAQMSFSPIGGLDPNNYECNLALGKCEIGPVPVGGLAVDLDGDQSGLSLGATDSSDGNALLLAGIIAGVSVIATTVTGVALYARRPLR